MAKAKKLTRAERYAELSAARATIIPEIVRLEKTFGVSVVAGAFARHTQIRRERRKLAAQQSEIRAKIAKLNS